MADVWMSFASHRVPRWKGARQCKVDLIRGIWDVFKNELRSAATPTTAFNQPSKWAAGRQAGRQTLRLVRPLNTPSSTWMGGLITLSLMIHWLVRMHTATADTSGDSTRHCSVSTAALASSYNGSIHNYVLMKVFFFLTKTVSFIFWVHSRKHNHNKVSSDALAQCHKKEVQLPICLNRWHITFSKLSDV